MGASEPLNVLQPGKSSMSQACFMADICPVYFHASVRVCVCARTQDHSFQPSE